MLLQTTGSWMVISVLVAGGVRRYRPITNENGEAIAVASPLLQPGNARPDCGFHFREL
jgi:hypothetical protein